MRLLLLPLFAASAALAAPVPGITQTQRSPQFTKEGAENGWIVVLKDDAPPSAFRRTTRDLSIAGFSGPRYTFDFGGSLRGHVVSGPGSELAVASMANSPHVSKPMRTLLPQPHVSKSKYQPV